MKIGGIFLFSRTLRNLIDVLEPKVIDVNITKRKRNFESRLFVKEAGAFQLYFYKDNSISIDMIDASDCLN